MKKRVYAWKKSKKMKRKDERRQDTTRKRVEKIERKEETR